MREVKKVLHESILDCTCIERLFSFFSSWLLTSAFWKDILAKMKSFSVLLVSCQLLFTKSIASNVQSHDPANNFVSSNSRRNFNQCASCLCQEISGYPAAQTVTVTKCTFNADKNELLVKNIQHERVAISKMITALQKKKKKRLIVTIESTDIFIIDDLSQHMIKKIGKNVLRDNPKLWFRSTSFFHLSGTVEVHAKGFYNVDVGSFIAETWFFNGVNFGELNLQGKTDWGMLPTKRVYIAGPTIDLPGFRDNEHLERLEIANVDILGNQASLDSNFLKNTKGIRALVIHNSPSVVLPELVIERMELVQTLSVRLDLPNIDQLSLKNISMVDSINGVRVMNKDKWRTAVDSDCRYFCGNPLIDRSKSNTQPECTEKKNPETFLCALCLRNRLGDRADFEKTKTVCGYNSQKSPDYSYDYRYNEGEDQDSDFYKSPQNVACLSWSTIILLVFHILPVSSVQSSVTFNWSQELILIQFGSASTVSSRVVRRTQSHHCEIVRVIRTMW